MSVRINDKEAFYWLRSSTADALSQCFLTTALPHDGIDKFWFFAVDNPAREASFPLRGIALSRTRCVPICQRDASGYSLVNASINYTIRDGSLFRRFDCRRTFAMLPHIKIHQKNRMAFYLPRHTVFYTFIGKFLVFKWASVSLIVIVQKH